MKELTKTCDLCMADMQHKHSYINKATLPKVQFYVTVFYWATFSYILYLVDGGSLKVGSIILATASIVQLAHLLT